MACTNTKPIYMSILLLLLFVIIAFVAFGLIGWVLKFFGMSIDFLSVGCWQVLRFIVWIIFIFQYPWNTAS